MEEILVESLPDLVDEFIAHQEKFNYPSSLPAYETGRSFTTMRTILIGKNMHPKIESAIAIKQFIERYNEDLEKLRDLKKIDLLHEDIRILHLGKKFEDIFCELDVITIEDLVRMTKKEIQTAAKIGPKTLEPVETKLKNIGLSFGLDPSKFGTKENGFQFSVDVHGTPDEVLLASNSIARYIASRLKMENVKIRFKGADIFDKDAEDAKKKKNKKTKKVVIGSSSTDQYPFQGGIVFKAGSRKMEILNKKYQSGKEMAKMLEDAAARIRAIENVKAFESSDLWVIDW